jgi:SAM-dependent methyltransferase
MTEQFGHEFWEERYRGRTAVWSGRPNPPLVAEAGDLAPGRALDAGCGEGADAIWLASRGWRVTAVDFATAALRRAREHADTLDADVASRIDWVPADLTGWTPPEGRFDLVSTHYVHLAGSREAFFGRLAASVAPGGTLLIVGHHPSDLQTTMPRPPIPELFFTAEEIATGLDPDQWDIAVAEARPRSADDPDGHEVTIHDAVLCARRRRPASAG